MENAHLSWLHQVAGIQHLSTVSLVQFTWVTHKYYYMGDKWNALTLTVC